MGEHQVTVGRITYRLPQLFLVMATQNPVDLDYKALSNTGTWCIGRLQTERDKDRVREGLAGAAGSDQLPLDRLDDILSGLGKRRFLVHNVHEREPVLIGSGGSIPVAGAVKKLLGFDCLLVGFSLDDDRMHSPNEKFELRCFEMGIRSPVLSQSL